MSVRGSWRWIERQDKFLHDLREAEGLARSAVNATNPNIQEYGLSKEERPGRGPDIHTSAKTQQIQRLGLKTLQLPLSEGLIQCVLGLHQILLQ